MRVMARKKKEKQARPSEEVFNQYALQTNDYDSEFDKELQSVQSLNFDKVQKIDNHCERRPPLKKWLTLSAVLSHPKSPKPLQ